MLNTGRESITADIQVIRQVKIIMARINTVDVDCSLLLEEDQMAPNSGRQRSEIGKDEWPLSRRSVLKTGALTTGGVLSLQPTGAAAARPDGYDGFGPPDPVFDSEDPDPDAAVIIKSLDVPISDWTVFGSYTVADHNRSYESDERVVIIAFENLLDSEWPEWRQARPDTLFDGVTSRGIKFHAFPQPRLERGRPD